MFLLAVSTTMYLLNNDGMDQLPYLQEQNTDEIRIDTVLKNFPLFCPKCKQETLICVNELNISVIKEPDA